MRAAPPATPAPIQLQSGLAALLEQCRAYDLLASAVAVVDMQVVLRYANPAFMRFNAAVRDNAANLSRHASLLECPEFHSWLLASLGASNAEPLHRTFYYAPNIQADLTVCLTRLLAQDGQPAGALLTLGEESIEFDRFHLARLQDSRRALAERIKILDQQNNEAQRLLNILVKEAPVAMVLLNERREVVQLNNAAAKLFETNIAEIRGRQCHQIFPCHIGSDGVCPALLPYPGISNSEIEMCVSEQRHLSLLRSVAVLQKTGSETMIIEAFVDLTARKEAEKAKSLFLSAMSHELRTPLNAILGFAQLLQSDDCITPDQQQSIKFILSAGYQLLGLVNDLLDLSRIEVGKLALNMHAVPVAELATSCTEQIISALARKNNIAVENRITDPGLLVQGDDLRIRQVLINMLSNAVKYNKQNGQVIISSAIGEGNRLRIQVQDTGNGLTGDQLSLLFKPFERIDQKHGTISGAGIGLHISRQLVEAMHGEIGVESTAGEGSTFWFELPLAPQADETTISPAPGKIEPQTQRDASEHVVLYVEDNLANAELIKSALQQYQGVKLLLANTAEEGLAIAEEEHPDLILMDIHLPGIDGITATTLLKGLDATRFIPVVALSADAMQENIDRALSSGCCAYLTKPIQLQALYEVIDRECMAKDG